MQCARFPGGSATCDLDVDGGGDAQRPPSKALPRAALAIRKVARAAWAGQHRPRTRGVGVGLGARMDSMVLAPGVR